MPVRDHWDVVRGCQGADLHLFRDAATPIRIGLQDVDRAGLEELLDLPPGVDVFAGGDGHGCGVLDASQGGDPLRRDRLLSQAGATGVSLRTMATA